MDEMFERCAGIDVHRDTLVVTVRTRSEGGRVRHQTRTFEAFHDTLLTLCAWLVSERVQVVGLESTGVYWRPVVCALQQFAAAAKIWLVNPRAVKQVPGRKTDVNDSQWLAKLVMHGLVRPSYVPPADIQELRTFTRHRRKLVRDATSNKNRILKQLEICGLKLASVCSDVFGKSGRAMLDAVLAGTQGRPQIAQLARGALRKKIPNLERALLGSFDPAAAFVVRQMLAQLDGLERDITAVDAEINNRLLPYNKQVAALSAMPGFDQTTIAVVIAETGGVMEKIDAESGEVQTVFNSADHLASWTGLSPGSYQSAGPPKKGPCRKGNEPLRTALVQAAWGAVATKGTFWKMKFRQLLPRLGPKKAIVAIARKLSVSLYWVLKGDGRYVEPAQPMRPLRAERMARTYADRIRALGFEVDLRPAAEMRNEAPPASTAAT
jgi:transposase